MLTTEQRKMNEALRRLYNSFCYVQRRSANEGVAWISRDFILDFRDGTLASEMEKWFDEIYIGGIDQLKADVEKDPVSLELSETENYQLVAKNDGAIVFMWKTNTNGVISVTTYPIAASVDELRSLISFLASYAKAPQPYFAREFKNTDESWHMMLCKDGVAIISPSRITPFYQATAIFLKINPDNFVNKLLKDIEGSLLNFLYNCNRDKYDSLDDAIRSGDFDKTAYELSNLIKVAKHRYSIKKITCEEAIELMNHRTDFISYAVHKYNNNNDTRIIFHDCTEYGDNFNINVSVREVDVNVNNFNQTLVEAFYENGNKGHLISVNDNTPVSEVYADTEQLYINDESCSFFVCKESNMATLGEAMQLDDEGKQNYMFILND